ncbi:MAG: septation protein SpoVG family protein [Candidatus Omnitrophota bacterium]|nr:septation protein SpoVG family protein [Candidatus Omnitrophota bacterium]
MEMLDFSVKRLHRFDKEGSLKAIADIAIGEEFLVKGFCVVEGKNGLFISEPRRPGNDGKWYGMACSLTDEVKKEIERVIMEALESEK